MTQHMYGLGRLEPVGPTKRPPNNPPTPRSVTKLAKLQRRRANIERRLRQLEKDFEAAGDMDAELRINDAMRQQRLYLLRIDRRLPHA